MALAEFPDVTQPAHQNAVANKAWVRGRIGELVGELARRDPVDDPAALADGLALLFEGVYASAQELGAEGPAARAQVLAEGMISASRR